MSEPKIPSSACSRCRPLPLPPLRHVYDSKRRRVFPFSAAAGEIDAGGYWFEIPARWTVLASVKTSGRPVEPRPRLLSAFTSEDFPKRCPSTANRLTVPSDFPCCEDVGECYASYRHEISSKVQLIKYLERALFIEEPTPATHGSRVHLKAGKKCVTIRVSGGNAVFEVSGSRVPFEFVK